MYVLYHPQFRRHWLPTHVLPVLFFLSIHFFLCLVQPSRFIQKLCPWPSVHHSCISLSLFSLLIFMFWLLLFVYVYFTCALFHTKSIHPSIQPCVGLCVVECMHNLVKSSFFPIVGWRAHPSSLMATSTIHSGIHNTNTAAIHTRKISHDSVHCTAKKLTLFLVCFCSQHAKWTAMRQSFPSHFLFHFISSQKLYFYTIFSKKKEGFENIYYKNIPCRIEREKNTIHNYLE